MAQKAKIQFEAYTGGALVQSVYRSTHVNSQEELKDYVFALVKKHYPELTLQHIVLNRKELDKGFWHIEAATDTHYFFLKASNDNTNP